MVQYSPYRRKRSHIPENRWQDAINRGVIREIDPEIREMVIVLNEEQQYTIDSCAGHGPITDAKAIETLKRPHSHFTRMRILGKGYLAFDPQTKLNDRYIRAVFQHYGLTGISRRKKDDYTVYYFDPVGKPRTMRKQ